VSMGALSCLVAKHCVNKGPAFPFLGHDVRLGLILYSKIPLLRPPLGPKKGLNWRPAVIEGKANFFTNGCNKGKNSMKPDHFQ